MRFIVVAVIVSTLWLTTVRAQEPPGATNTAASSEKTPALPDMPAPKPPVRVPWWRCWMCLGPRREQNTTNLPPFVWNVPDRVTDKRFLFVDGWAIGSAILVTAGTNHCRHTVGVGRCIGSDGPFKATQGIQIGLSGFLVGLGYWWKKWDQQTQDKHPQWWVFPVGAGAVNTFMAADQFSKHCPKGTMFDGHTCK
jgi:hypothetical protein